MLLILRRTEKKQMNEQSYSQKKKIENTVKIRELLSSLPPYVTTYIRGIEQYTSSLTQIAYLIDLKVFFEFLQKNNPLFSSKELKEIPFDIIKELTAADIEEYLDHLKFYSSTENKNLTNSESGIKRKLSSLRSFYGYFHTHQIINENPTLQVRMPKLHDKNIIRMEENEIANFLDTVEQGNSMSKQQLVFHEKNKIRDLAITTLMLGTGIRVSECVGIDIKDIDFDNDRVNIVRKGGKESFVYFGEEVREALLTYYGERKKMIPEAGSENAFFLSLRMKRISVRNVEELVKKYALTSVSSKHITPHKLRSTYGTQLYKETGDIYLVADVLGHKDVNTTKKHYAALEENRRRSAKDAVTLRENPNKKEE